MRFDILTLFPEFFISPLEQSLLGKAVAKGVLTVTTRNLRDFTTDRHRTTDDSPYGGGHGMVMKVEPVVAAIEALKAEGPAGRVILTTPQGVPLTQSLVRELSGEERLIIVCGRYEGVDERIRAFVDTEISLGDFVLTGGEVAALALVDSVGRLVPGVLGEPGSAEHDSFSDGLLEYPQYTRPEDFRGLKVPEVLLSGNHAEIERWRRTESLERTADRRPDLIEKAGLTEAEKRLVKKRSGRGA